MAIQGISFGEVHEYISRKDPARTKEDGATVFYWGAISNVMMVKIADQQQTTSVEVGDVMRQTFNQKTAARNREAFRHGIRRPAWDNFLDSEGKPILPDWENIMEGGRSYEVLTDAVLDKVPLYIIQEVGAHIFNTNSLGEDERKNLEAALSPFDGLGSGAAKDAPSKTEPSEDASDQPSSTDESHGKSKKQISTGRTQQPKKNKTDAQDGSS
jgi:hypothetical protein